MNRKTRYINLLVLVLIFGGITAFYLFSGNDVGTVIIGEKGFILEFDKGDETLIPYDEIQGYRLIEELSLLEVVDGKRGLLATSGIWEIDGVGECHVFLHTRGKTAILLQTEDGSIAFNCDSDGATKALYDEMEHIISYYTGGNSPSRSITGDAL